MSFSSSNIRDSSENSNINQKNDLTKDELFFEAVDSLADLNINSAKNSYNGDNKNNTNFELNGRIIRKNKNFSLSHISSSKEISPTPFLSGITDFTDSKISVKNSIKNFEKIENLNNINLLNSTNESGLNTNHNAAVYNFDDLKLTNHNDFNSSIRIKTKLKSNEILNSPIAMNINNNIKSSPKINLNFNININYDKDENNIKISKYEDTVEKVINLVKIETEKPNESLYETAKIDTDDENNSSAIYYKNNMGIEITDHYTNLKNFRTLSNDDETIYDPISLKKKITDIKFEVTNDIDLSFFFKNMRVINVKNKQVSPHNRHFRYLLELQNFIVDLQQIWIVKMSNNQKYLATGGKSGVLKIFEIMNFNSENYQDSYTNEDVISYLNFINEKPYRVYNDHSNDIIDICWSTKNNNILLTASLDHLVIMWDIQYEYPLSKFTHSSIVTCICFYQSSDTDEEEKFVSGCLDKIIRIWSLKKNKVLDYINIKEYITAISYLPTGDMIAVGTHNGRVSIYDCKPKLRYNFSFTCRNRMGKYAYGRKITSIEFVNRTQALITTNDSRIRLVNISDGKLVQKYKGHVNEEYMIKSFPEDSHDLVISASEEGHVFLWNLFNKESKAKKNYSYEFFRPFKHDISACSFFVNDEATANYLKKLFNLTTKVMVHSIIINASVSGYLQILLNCDSMENF